MNACANVDPERLCCARDRYRAAHRAGRAVEDGENAFAAGVDLAAAEATDLGADDRVVPIEQLAQPPAPERGGLRRPDDVRKEN